VADDEGLAVVDLFKVIIRTTEEARGFLRHPIVRERTVRERGDRIAGAEGAHHRNRRYQVVVGVGTTATKNGEPGREEHDDER